jgi:hypothetical protein
MERIRVQAHRARVLLVQLKECYEKYQDGYYAS